VLASLLPGAGQHLPLRKQNAGLIPMPGETPVTKVNQRMDILRKRYGQRCAEMPLYDFVRGKQKSANRRTPGVAQHGNAQLQERSNPILCVRGVRNIARST
jgi:hypothetical protein